MEQGMGAEKERMMMIKRSVWGGRVGQSGRKGREGSPALSKRTV